METAQYKYHKVIIGVRMINSFCLNNELRSMTFTKLDDSEVSSRFRVGCAQIERNFRSNDPWSSTQTPKETIQDSQKALRI